MIQQHESLRRRHGLRSSAGNKLGQGPKRVGRLRCQLHAVHGPQSAVRLVGSFDGIADERALEDAVAGQVARKDEQRRQQLLGGCGGLWGRRRG